MSVRVLEYVPEYPCRLGEFVVGVRVILDEETGSTELFRYLDAEQAVGVSAAASLVAAARGAPLLALQDVDVTAGLWKDAGVAAVIFMFSAGLTSGRAQPLIHSSSK